MKNRFIFVLLSLLISSSTLTAMEHERNRDDSVEEVNKPQKKRKVNGPLVKKACFHCKRGHRKCSDYRPCKTCSTTNKQCFDEQKDNPQKIVPISVNDTIYQNFSLPFFSIKQNQRLNVINDSQPSALSIGTPEQLDKELPTESSLVIEGFSEKGNVEEIVIETPNIFSMSLDNPIENNNTFHENISKRSTIHHILNYSNTSNPCLECVRNTNDCDTQHPIRCSFCKENGLTCAFPATEDKNDDL